MPLVTNVDQMNYRFATSLALNIAKSHAAAQLRFAVWLMVLTVLTFNSFESRNADAQPASSTPVSADRDTLCAPLALSSVCDPAWPAIGEAPQWAPTNRAAVNSADARNHFDFTLPDLGTKQAGSHLTSKQPGKSALIIPLFQQLARTGQLASSGIHLGDVASGYFTNRANQYVFGGLQQWLSQFGTANISMSASNHGQLNDGSASVLLPLYDNKGSSLIFSQLGYQRWDGRNTVNVGLGGRHFGKHSMYGANVFFDDDLTGRNQRLGTGVEFGTDYLRLSANGYLGLTGWHQSRDYTDYEERPASGFDVTSQMYLPALPQLGAKLKYEQYFGGGVDLLGTGNRQKDPFAVTVGLDYTPVPAITVGADYRRGERGLSDVQLSIQLTYRMGVPLSEQFDPRAVASMRSLAGSRYDLVQRNNRIVLDYRKRVFIRLTLASALNGYPGEVVPLQVSVTSTHGLQSIQWNAPELMAHGGAIISQNGTTYTLTFPAYQPGGSNIYTVNAVARDRQGNTSSPAQMQVTVLPPAKNVSVDKSATEISPNRIFADGHSTATLTISALDNNGNSVSGLAQDIELQPSFSANPTAQVNAAAKTASAAPLAPTLGSISAQGNGVYVATITAGTQLGSLTVTPVLKSENVKLKSATLQLVSANSQANPSITDPIVVAPQATQPANGLAAYTFTARVVDANTGNPLPKYPLVGLRWQVSPSPASLQNAGWLVLTPGSSTTDDNGNITATLTSRIANTPFAVSAQLGTAAPHNAAPVTFSLVARIDSLTIVDPSSGNTEITTINNGLNTPIRLHAPLPLGATAQQGFAFIARIVDARGVPVANQPLSSLNFQWIRARTLSVDDRYREETSTDGLGQAMAYFGSVAQTGTTGPFTLSAQMGSQTAHPAQPATVAFTDIPADTQQIIYVDPNGSVLTAAIPASSAIAFVKDVTYLRLDPATFDPSNDAMVNATSSTPDVVSVDSSSGRMNVLKPGSAIVTAVFAHNEYRFARSVTLTPQSVLFVPREGNQTVSITSPAVDPGNDNDCEAWAQLSNVAGIQSVDRSDVEALLGKVPQAKFGSSFWGANPPPSVNRRFFMKDAGAQLNWASLSIPGNSGIVRNDANDGTLVCKYR